MFKFECINKYNFLFIKNFTRQIIQHFIKKNYSIKAINILIKIKDTKFNKVKITFTQLITFKKTIINKLKKFNLVKLIKLLYVSLIVYI